MTRIVYDWVAFNARRRPDHQALIDLATDRRYSYATLYDRVERAARYLRTLEVGRGDRVAILGENSLEHLVMFMAASKIGAVTVSLNYRLAPAELAYIINDAQAKVLVALDGMEESLAGLRQQLASDIVVLSQGFADTLD